MATLSLANSDQMVLIDDADYSRFSHYRLRLNAGGYATITNRCHGESILLHRQIISAPKGIMVDHKNQNRLDNRKENLRLCTRSQNMANHKVHVERSGVHWHGQNKKWQVRVGGAYQGTFTDWDAAANCYNQRAKEKYGEFAITIPCKTMLPEEWTRYQARVGSTSRYTGVCRPKGRTKWFAQATVDKRLVTIGYFDQEKDAALAYNAFVCEHGLNRPINVV